MCSLYYGFDTLLCKDIIMIGMGCFCPHHGMAGISLFIIASYELGAPHHRSTMDKCSEKRPKLEMIVP